MSDSRFAKDLKPPYYAVIFTALRTDGDRGYARTAERMVELAAEQPGYLGVESVRDASGFGITVSYWESAAAIAAWKANSEHRIAQELGMRCFGFRWILGLISERPLGNNKAHRSS